MPGIPFVSGFLIYTSGNSRYQ